MLTRAAVLERFGLLNREAFDILSENQLSGIWMILFGHEGDPSKLMPARNGEPPLTKFAVSTLA